MNNYFIIFLFTFQLSIQNHIYVKMLCYTQPNNRNVKLSYLQENDNLLEDSILTTSIQFLAELTDFSYEILENNDKMFRIQIQLKNLNDIAVIDPFDSDNNQTFTLDDMNSDKYFKMQGFDFVYQADEQTPEDGYINPYTFQNFQGQPFSPSLSTYDGQEVLCNLDVNLQALDRINIASESIILEQENEDSDIEINSDHNRLLYI